MTARPLHRAGARSRSARVCRAQSATTWQNNVLSWQERGAPRVTAPADARPIVVLPGFGNDTEDYVEPFGQRESAITTLLQERGWHVGVVQLQRREWFRVGRSLFTRGYWTNSLTTHPGYTWYLDKVAEAVDAAREATGCQQVDLVGHSAGGWLGRAFLADPRYAPGAGPDAPNPAVRSIVTLGTPQRPPPPGSGARDMTGGALTWCDSTYPGAFFAPAGVRYVCVAGRAVRGAPPSGKERTLSSYAHGSYRQVLGSGDGVEGDAVVPLASAHLEGATNLVLDGVLHSMSQLGTFKEPAPEGVVWYGSDAVLDCWLSHLAGNDDSPAAAAAGEAAAPVAAVLDP